MEALQNDSNLKTSINFSKHQVCIYYCHIKFLGTFSFKIEILNFVWISSHINPKSKCLDTIGTAELHLKICPETLLLRGTQRIRTV